MGGIVMEYLRVYVTQDNDGHDYIVPYVHKDEFDTLLELSETSEEAEEEFIDKFSEYMTGGDINLTPLFIENPNPNALSS